VRKWFLMDIEGIFVVPGASYLCKPQIIMFIDVDLKQARIRLESGLFCGQGIANGFLPSSRQFSFTQSVVLEG